MNRTIVGGLLVTLAAIPSLATAAAARPLLSEAQRAIFCGAQGTEPSGAYSEAVMADLKRRNPDGKRPIREVLAEMTAEYCKAPQP